MNTIMHHKSRGSRYMRKEMVHTPTARLVLSIRGPELRALAHILTTHQHAILEVIYARNIHIRVTRQTNRPFLNSG